MSHIARRALAFAALPLVLFACTAPTGEAGEPAAEPVGTTSSELGFTIDPCGLTSTVANVTTSPSNFTLQDGPSSRVSEDAAYAYKAGCDKFIVDTRVGPDAHNYEAVALRGAAADLPSSSAVGGELPANAIDCARFRLYVDFWSKAQSESYFKKLSTGSFAGNWLTSVGGAPFCELKNIGSATGKPELIASRPTDGTTTTYRTATKAVLRGTAQEVGVIAEGWIEPPR